MITPTNTEDLLKWDLNELWSCFQTILTYEEEKRGKLEDVYKEELQNVKEGIKFKIPIWYLTNKWYEEFPAKKGVKVLGYGRYNINEFQQEIEKRKTIMRNVISEESTDTDLTEPDIGGEPYGS